MIDVVSYLNQTSTGLNTTEKTEGTDDSQDLGKDEFMQLLITQLTNQNPLEPMENTEFIAQLAQFSSLEIMQNIASGMELLALTQTAATNSQMVNLIGKRVIVPGSEFTIDSENPVKLQFDVDSETLPSQMVIKDSSGEVVRTIDLTGIEQGLNEYEFDGKDNDGNFLEPGNYTYELVNYDGESLEDITTYSNYLIDSVAFEGTTIYLKSGDNTIDLSDVTQVLNN